MRVLVAMLPEWGGFIPTLALAKELRGRGHEVVFLGIPFPGEEPPERFAPFFAEQGFPFHRIDPSPPAGERSSVLSGGHAERVLDQVERFVRRQGTDLALVDALISWVALAPDALGVPVVALKATLLSPFNLRQPPFTAPLAGTTEEIGRGPILAAWIRRWIELVLVPSLRRPWNAPFRLGWLGLRGHLRRRGRRQGFPWRFTEYGPRLQLQCELYLCPAAWEPDPPPGRWYAGAAPDPARVGPVPDSMALRSGVDLVLCSLGTHSDRYPGAAAFFQTVVEAFRLLPHLDLVLHVGDLFEPDHLEPIPPNVRIERWIPQPALLDRAALMITHAGMGAVKEAIAAGVPMLACPFRYDQPSNAARIEYHGLGEREDPTRLTASRLARRVESLLDRREVLAADLERMQAHFLDTAPLQAAADRLEELADGPPGPGAEAGAGSDPRPPTGPGPP